MHNLKELKIWKKAVDLAVEVYEITKKFPEEEKFGLISQLRRAVISIPSNIAEGAGRNSDNEFIHFIGIANGSAFETQTQIIIAYRLKFIETETYKLLLKTIEEIQKMSRGLQNKLGH